MCARGWNAARLSCALAIGRGWAIGGHRPRPSISAVAPSLWRLISPVCLSDLAASATARMRSRAGIRNPFTGDAVPAQALILAKSATRDGRRPSTRSVPSARCEPTDAGQRVDGRQEIGLSRLSAGRSPRQNEHRGAAAGIRSAQKRQIFVASTWASLGVGWSSCAIQCTPGWESPKASRQSGLLVPQTAPHCQRQCPGRAASDFIGALWGRMRPVIEAGSSSFPAGTASCLADPGCGQPRHREIESFPCSPEPLSASAGRAFWVPRRRYGCLPEGQEGLREDASLEIVNSRLARAERRSRGNATADPAAFPMIEGP